METKKRNLGLIITVVVLIMLLLFTVSLFFLYSMGYLNFNKSNINNQENNLEVSISDDFKITYKNENYTDKNNNGFVVLKNNRNLPTIESKNYENSANKIELYLKNVSNKKWEELKYNMSEYNDFDTKMDIGVELLFSTERITDEYVSFDLNQTGGMGGVSWDEKHGYSFNIHTGDILDFSSICISTTANESFYNYVVNNIENNSNLILEENWKQIVNQKMFEIGNWYFTNGGIQFIFEKYLIGPGANGVIKVDVPYSFANQYLKEIYRG